MTWQEHMIAGHMHCVAALLIHAINHLWINLAKMFLLFLAGKRNRLKLIFDSPTGGAGEAGQRPFNFTSPLGNRTSGESAASSTTSSVPDGSTPSYMADAGYPTQMYVKHRSM